MNAPITLRAQRGATLIVGLIMLVLITLMVTAAFMMSTGNLKAVGNMQFRNEAIAAANAATEEVLTSLLIGGSTVMPPSQDLNVDLHNGSPVYAVHISQPTCVRASVAAPGYSSSLSLGNVMTTQSAWNTIWDVQADVNNDAGSSATVRVRQGVRVLLTLAQKNAVCP